MFKKWAIGMFILVAVFMVAGVVMAQENETTVSVPETMMEPAAAVEPPATPAPMDVVEAGNKICPVSGMAIMEPGKYTVEYEGKIYNLCSETCRETFLKDPATYVAKVEAELTNSTPGAQVASPQEVVDVPPQEIAPAAPEAEPAVTETK